MKIIRTSLDVDLPSDRLCMVMAQPFFRIQQTDNGLKIDRSILENHKRMIRFSLELVSNLSFENATHKTNFALFPELCLPFDIVSELRDCISNSWPPNSILMGGIEGINGREYSVLLENSNNPAETEGDLPGVANYINCGIIIVKDKNEEVSVYLQPKIKASENEQAIGMVEGEHVFLFKTTNYNFLCLICFDFIGRDQTSPVRLIQDMMQQLGCDVPEGYCLNLDVIFVLQCNEDPSHRCFQDSARILLHEGRGKIETRSVVFVNTAAEYFGSSRQYGKSAFYFPRGTWTIMDRGRYPVNHTFALERTDYACERARLREDGPCIHSIVYIPRKALGGDSGDIRYPLVPPPLCYKVKLDGSLEDGRVVPALEKIVSDNLPANLAANDNRWNAPNAPSLGDQMRQEYGATREKLINVRIERMKELIDLLLMYHYPENNRVENPDYWEAEKEGEAIKELASTLSILTLNDEIALDVPSKILTGLLKEKFYVAVIDGKWIPTSGVLRQEYKKYVERNTYMDIDLEKNILLVLCRHRGEQPPNGIAEEIADFTLISRAEDSNMPQELQEANKFTSVSGGRIFWHSRESLQGILEQNDLEGTRNKLEEKVAPLRN